MWMVDKSGAREDVLSFLREANFDDVVDTTSALVTHANVEKQVNPGANVIQGERADMLVDRLRFLSKPNARPSYERAVAFAIAEIEQSKSPRVGVTLRAMPIDGGGTRVVCDVSEYLGG